MSNLAPGRIRYGVMVSEAGRITDDGTVCRLDDDAFYVTTTSSGVAAVEAADDLVAGGLGSRRPRHRPHAGRRGDEPRRSEGARDPRRAHRDRLLQRGLQVPRRQARDGRRRAVAAAAHRLRRRGRLRDPLPGAAGVAPLEDAARRRRRRGGHAVRPRAAAGPAPAEAARHRRAGHRLGVDAVQHRDGLGRQARQGAGLHRALGARARCRTDRTSSWSGSRCRPGT